MEAASMAQANPARLFFKRLFRRKLVVDVVTEQTDELLAIDGTGGVAHGTFRFDAVTAGASRASAHRAGREVGVGHGAVGS